MYPKSLDVVNLKELMDTPIKCDIPLVDVLRNRLYLWKDMGIYLTHVGIQVLIAKIFPPKTLKIFYFFEFPIFLFRFSFSRCHLSPPVTGSGWLASSGTTPLATRVAGGEDVLLIREQREEQSPCFVKEEENRGRVRPLFPMKKKKKKEKRKK